MNLLILMAGGGTRLKKFYEEPKPYINISGYRIIEWVLKNTNLKCKHIFIAQKDSAQKYKLKEIIEKFTKSYSTIFLNKITQGAAETALEAIEHIDNTEELVIINSDQYFECNIEDELNYFRNDKNIDGGILTFKKKNDPKWSYVKTNGNGIAIEVAEKKPISENATVGVYYWKKGCDFVNSARNMISKNIRINNEFYICPVYNEAINENKKIKIKQIKNMLPLGTIEEIKKFEIFIKNL